MANQKYYWLKLQKDFFKRHDIRIIKAMPNGKEYIIFYLILLLESLSHEGALRFSDEIPYNEDMLATITETNIDIVRSAMKVFTELKMIEILDDNTVFMAEVNKMIGCESSVAERVRKCREKGNSFPQLADNLLQCNTEMLHGNKMKQKCNTEKEIELELELEKDIDTIINNSNKKERKETFDDIINFYTNDFELRLELKEHLKTRKNKKSALTNRALELSLKKLSELVSDDKTKIKIVQNSIMNGWTGFFALKEETANIKENITDYDISDENPECKKRIVVKGW